jgi:hypothetical protein
MAPDLPAPTRPSDTKLQNLVANLDDNDKQFHPIPLGNGEAFGGTANLLWTPGMEHIFWDAHKERGRNQKKN